MSTEIGIKQASVLLKLSEQRVRTLCRHGLIEARKIGTTWLIEEASVQQYGLKTHTL